MQPISASSFREDDPAFEVPREATATPFLRDVRRLLTPGGLATFPVSVGTVDQSDQVRSGTAVLPLRASMLMEKSG